jgi:hypothetical protein
MREKLLVLKGRGLQQGSEGKGKNRIKWNRITYIPKN